MTYHHSTAKKEITERDYDSLEMDVRRCMKEACSAYKHETAAAIAEWKARKAPKKGLFARFFLAVAVVSLTSGCGLLGVRELELWKGGTKWTFAEGLDFHVGANSIDNVKDQRGVTPRSAGTNLKEVKY